MMKHKLQAQQKEKEENRILLVNPQREPKTNKEDPNAIHQIRKANNRHNINSERWWETTQNISPNIAEPLTKVTTAIN